MKLTKKQQRELQAVLEPMRFAGQKMSNLCFNLQQRDTMTADDKRVMGELYQAWDKAQKAVHAALKGGEK